MDLENKHVVIVGGGSGMGLGLAKAALDRGAKVTIAGRSQDRLDKANETLGNRAVTASLDAGDADSAKNAYASMGSIDHLVTTAAALTYAPIADIALEDVQQMLAGKFWGPFFAARFAGATIREGGSITFFSGLAAYRPGPGTAVVAAVNAGLEGLAKALAVELAPLRVNVLSPGVVETPGWDFMPEADRRAFFEGQTKSLPSRYVGTPADVAEAALSLMTNRYVTGTVLHVDGGGRLA
ncbi:SDR family oxidoreductase [Neorhizobium alkalisoli]|uniref:NAD(P)-dependent dehydrogenase (Short-subunit alcohol dehydrogenase family) n=1 Tax=Neorhizobium alkalisoli TaxID=528178 RepID=A0A561QB04_9HYPH|nr:SDR family oxidoreductase [Neorhizobium alkalisoli]TWF47539.1 NAD(P)-dependent dehydrogenase (short-subunit alcohol dehydrogenase family) [Neorhizobium alkalisoli]